MKVRKGTTLDPRTLLAIGHDIVVAGLAWVAAFWLRLNLAVPPNYEQVIIGTVGIVVCVEVLIFLTCGLYRGIWRYASIFDFRRILTAIGITALAIPTVVVLLRISEPIPRSVYLLNPLLLLCMMGGGRFAYRLWKDGRSRKALRTSGVPLLVLGVNDMAERLVREFATQTRWRAVGLLDETRRRLGRDIHGVRVLGLIKQVKHHARQLGVDHVLLAIPNTQSALRRRAMQLAASAGLRVLSPPSFEELLTGQVAITQLKDVEFEELLGRRPVSLESAEVTQLVRGRTILVTGAGGSIGSELARQIAQFNPLRMVLLDVSEFALFQVEQYFRRLYPSMNIVCATGDVKDKARVSDLMARHQPEIVFHAAAYKHVPLMETENAWEAIRNNALGTYIVAGAAIEFSVDKFVLISTDKAVNPTNVMGASKRLAEMLIQGLQQDATTRFVTVRFGNVLGSAGSVVPKFREQIAQGGPVTVTHPEVTRYFMSIPEASQLVLHAGALGNSGEVYVLDMGRPVKVVDLAREMIRLSGNSEEDIPIIFTGMRPGEKLYEEVLAGDEHTLPTPHAKLRIARARTTEALQMDRIISWISQSQSQSDESVRARLRELVHEYAPAERDRMTPTASSAALKIVVNR